MAKLFLCLAAANGFTAVALGAFGAHGLKGRLSDTLFSAFETGVQYHFYHSLALLGVAVVLLRTQANQLFTAAGWLFVAGILMFSGSLYALALGGPKWLGPVTPLGGVCFMLAWLVTLVGALKL